MMVVEEIEGLRELKSILCDERGLLRTDGRFDLRAE